MEDIKTNILDLTYTDIEAYVEGIKQPKFRAQQLVNWIYKRFVFDLEQMHNLPKAFKVEIDNTACMYMPKVSHVSYSKADNSYKFLLKTNDDKLIEAILMLDKGRATVCVSCMIGCPLGCKFCATGSQVGFIRKLTVAEIVGQVLAILQYSKDNEITNKITNIVFMGMGEPLLNKEAVEKSIDIFTHPKCLALSPSKISVSTSGVGEGLADFIHKTGVRLAVSLHFTTDDLRSHYMPINKHFPIDKLIKELQKIKLKKRDYILIEYIMFRGINDTLHQARQLLGVIGNLKVKINLIPYNPTETLAEKASDEQTMNEFAQYLNNKGVFTSIRRSKGTGIDGGCGQFALKKANS